LHAQTDRQLFSLVMDNDAVAHPKIKRRKLHSDPATIRIASASNLQDLLTSPRNSLPELKTALQEFKEFLHAITLSEDSEDVAKNLQILRAYSEEQLSSQEGICFPDLIGLWSSAVEKNDESILSSLPHLISVLLEIFSKRLDFRDVGLSLCKCLLLKNQLRLLDRGLTATKTKEHLITPCLQLLTEVVSFDGGEFASLVYSQRDTTFKRLEVFLEHRGLGTGSQVDWRQKPTLRYTAQRYLMANLKFQGASAKADIIAQGKILRACLQTLKFDRPEVIREVLVSLEYDIIKASTLTKSIQGRLFNSSNLSSLANLYALQEAVNEVSSGRTIREQVDGLLRLVCTQQENGILLPQNGWYPPRGGLDQSLAVAADPNEIDLTRRLQFSSIQTGKLPVKNGILSTFILTLKPERDKLQAALLRDIFGAAPELVADYFSRKNSFIAEPKDIPQWLGQSAFIFSVIQLPVPAYCGLKDGFGSLPPPSSTAIESILPRPLDRPNTTRSLNLNHEVITLFAVRAVTVAFQKLAKVLEIYHASPINPESWKQASSDLVSVFSRRCPQAKDVISAFQRTPKSDEQLRASIVELLRNYYQTLPHLMLLEKFDISLTLVDAIKRVEDDAEDQSRKASRFAELENLLKIAQLSPDTKWWHKPGKL
jgi:nucleolar pre-ribosomal-associated protein 1